MYVFMKVGGRKIKGERKNKLLKHIFAICRFSLIFYARVIAFYPPIRNPSMQRDFSNPSYIFLCILVLFSLTASFQNALKRVKSHKIAHDAPPGALVGCIRHCASVNNSNSTKSDIA